MEVNPSPTGGTCLDLNALNPMSLDVTINFHKKCSLFDEERRGKWAKRGVGGDDGD